MNKLAKKLPNWIKSPAKKLKRYFKFRAYRGNERYCPVCKISSNQFVAGGTIPREDALCVHCGALERHRLLWLYINNRTDLFNGQQKKVLHIAPEPCFEPLFKKKLGASYMTADLFNPAAMLKMDITDIQYPKDSFDVIYCSHVLEHVSDDKKAMREFHRVLKSDGWAILLVPIYGKETFEDPSIVDPQARFEAYGQDDHVRLYGPDYIDRLRESGFTVDMLRPSDIASPEEVIKMGLTSGSGEIYVCTK